MYPRSVSSPSTDSRPWVEHSFRDGSPISRPRAWPRSVEHFRSPPAAETTSSEVAVSVKLRSTAVLHLAGTDEHQTAPDVDDEPTDHCRRFVEIVESYVIDELKKSNVRSHER